MGVPPKNRWMVYFMANPNLKFGWWLGVPLFQETSIWAWTIITSDFSGIFPRPWNHVSQGLDRHGICLWSRMLSQWNWYHGKTAWWFGTWISFFHILGIIVPTDEHIFQRGWNHQPVKPFIHVILILVLAHRNCIPNHDQNTTSLRGTLKNQHEPTFLCLKMLITS